MLDRALFFGKLYRAVEELDDLTDAECERLVVRAKLRRGDAAWVLPLAAGVVAGAVVCAVGVVVGGLVVAARSPMGLVSGEAKTLIWAASLAGAVAVLTLVFAVVQRWLLLGTLRDLANRAGCPFCEFSLVGLTPVRGAVKCPECGEVVLLHEHRIQPEDLLGRTPGARRGGKVLGAGPLGAYTGGKGRGAGPEKVSPTMKVIPAVKPGSPGSATSDLAAAKRARATPGGAVRPPGGP